MRNLRNIYWIGTRESEIYNTGDLFEGSITVFGSNEHSNYSFDKEYMWLLTIMRITLCLQSLLTILLREF